MEFRIIDVMFVERGKGETTAFVIRATRSNSNRTAFAGYVNRLRPGSDVWIAATRRKKGDPVHTAKGTLEDVQGEIRDFLLNRR